MFQYYSIYNKCDHDVYMFFQKSNNVSYKLTTIFVEPSRKIRFSVENKIVQRSVHLM